MLDEPQKRRWLETLCEDLPVFPLPELAMLPGSLLPLHVFEGRYRDLVGHCLGLGGGIGVATLKPGYGANYEGSPPIHEEIGVGRIVSHEPLEDGRSNIIVQALGSALVCREHQGSERFRRFECRLLKPHRGGTTRAILQLRMLLVQLGSTSERAAEEVERMMGMNDAKMLDLLAGQLLPRATERRRYLRMESWLERIHWMEGKLATFVVSQTPDIES